MTAAAGTVGLRERKKARTRAAIQEHALRLFSEQGYHETTTEQIAASAEISVSTLFRYFATKEDLVLYDALDPAMAAALEAQPPELSPVQAVRVALSEVLTALNGPDGDREAVRQRLVYGVPELRARLYEQYVSTMRVLAEAMAVRLGRPADDEAVRLWSGAVVGVLIAAFERDDQATIARADFAERVDRAMTFLEGGLAL
jgi:AcrR family transcriptional regulator